MVKLTQLKELNDYDWVVVGSGNGACAFLNHYLARTSQGGEKFLVLEEGDNFFETSDITHQRNWTQSYAEGNIFKLHTAQTPEQTPILCGRACTMGGGGSINYTMIFESSDWLVENFGHDHDYWNDLKKRLGEEFRRPDPKPFLTPVAEHVKVSLETSAFQLNEQEAGYIPVYQEGVEKQIHIFPTQFNEFGQRTNSGVSLVDWSHNPRLDFYPQCRVTRLKLSAMNDGLQRCVAITLLDLKTGQECEYPLSENTRLLLCAGAATPQLLYEYREQLNNFEIGKHVNDHIVLPFGIYLLNKSRAEPDRDTPLVPTLKDQYVSLFATQDIPLSASESESESESPKKVICNFDFFSGSLETLLYLISHLFLAFWVPNNIKFWMIRKPRVFQCLKFFSRLFVQLINTLDNVLWFIRYPHKMERHEWNLISAIVKFNIAREGYYQPSQDCHLPAETPQNWYEVILRCFEADSSQVNLDYDIAKQALTEQFSLMEKLGDKPNSLIQCFIRLLTRMPYEEEQVDGYINHYSRKDLLTEQHLSGGCVLGKAADLGLRSHLDTGKVCGSDNLFVADLSASPLPRVSPQMTAYLIGYHVAHQLTRT